MKHESREWVAIVILFFFSYVLCDRNASLEYEGTFLSGLLSLSPAFTVSGENLSPQCLSDAQEFMRDLHDLKYWAFQMYDSTAKPSAGLLNGNLNTYGDFEQCLSVPHPRIKGKYCLLGFDADFQSNSSYKGVIRQLMTDAYSDRPFHGPEHNTPLMSPLARQKFLWGFCIPSSCGVQDLQNSLEQTLAPFNSPENGLKIEVIPLEESCTMELRKKFTGWSYLVMFLMGILALLISLSTLYDHYTHTVKGSLVNVQNLRGPLKVILAFSLKRTIPFMLDIKRKNDGSDISCVDGIRFIFAMVLFLSHRCVLLSVWPMVNRTAFMRQIAEKNISMILRATMNNVDVFVLISGILSSFHGLKHLQFNGKLNVPMLYLKRYAKFTPGFMAIVLIIRDISPHIIRNPHNLSIIDTCVKNCRSIWKVITYTGNLDSVTEMCYQISHTLHIDMQLYLMSPFLIMFLWRYRTRAFATLAVAAVLLSFYSGWIVYRDKLSPIFYHGMTWSLAAESFDKLYLNTFLRLPPYLIGILLGYILHNVKTCPLGIDKPIELLAHSVSLLGAYYSYFWLKKCAVPSYEYNALEMAIYKALQPIVWNCALGWFIYACYTGRLRIIGAVLSLPPFLVFSRMSYAYYLVQAGVMVALLQFNRSPLYSQFVNTMDAAHACAVFFATVTMTLSLYLPVILIEKHFRSSKDKTKREEIHGETNGAVNMTTGDQS